MAGEALRVTSKNISSGSLDNPEVERLTSAIDRITLGAGAHEQGAPAPIRSVIFDRIVACTDGGPSTANVAAWAREVAKAFRGQVWPVHVVEPELTATGYAPVAQGMTLEKFGQETVSWVEHDLATAKIRAHPTVRTGFVVSQVLAVAKEAGANLIVSGTHGSSRLAVALLGSTSDGLKNHAEASVLIAKDMAPPGSILLPTDGSRPSRQAGVAALALAESWKVPLLVLHVVKSLGKDVDADTAKFRETFGQLHVPPWKDRRVTFEARVGRPADTILHAADELDRPLIVMGSRGLTGLRSLVPGSVTNAVAHRSKNSVLIVK